MLRRRPVILIGAGGHARVLADALDRLRINVLGATDARPGGIRNFPLPLIGNDEYVLKKFKPANVYLVNGIAGIETDSLRAAIYRRFKKNGYEFLRVIHPSAVMARDVGLSEGVQVMAGAVIQAGAILGENALVNTRASIDHGCRIGAHTHVAPGAVLCGDIRIGEGCHIGAGAVIVQGLSIPKGSFIKAGELVKGKSRR
ncbi:MAG: acetyltransferase [Candidatus Omnitrophica bacterium]|nr:acetyltransferase [Candidatus Omnitrophota bacterium]